MKKIISILLIFTFIIMTPVISFATLGETGTDTNGFVWEELSDNKAKITDYTGTNLNNVVIPSTVTNAAGSSLTVTEIGQAAFSPGLSPTGHLTGSITIPNTITTIDTSAFRFHLLDEIHIPNSVINIGDNAFNRKIHEINPDPTILTFEPNSSLLTIGEEAFMACIIENVTIPNSVMYISKNAFSGNEISSLSFEADSCLTTIGDKAFMSNKIENVTIPNSVICIDREAFWNNDISSLLFEADSVLAIIAGRAFLDNEIENVTIPNTVIYIDSEAFKNNNVTSFILPEVPGHETVNVWESYEWVSSGVSDPIKSIVRYDVNAIVSDMDAYYKFLGDPLPQYTVSFDTQGGSTVGNQTVIDGDYATEATEPTKTNFSFSGWYTDSACTDDNRWNFTTSQVTSDITLYAKWNSILTIDTPNLLAATLGGNYSCTISASGGDGSYSWYASGLPSGLSIARDTGIISGKPNEIGAFNVNIRVYDGENKRATKDYTLTVSSPSATGKYEIVPDTDSAYTISEVDGFTTLTINSGVSGFKYFKASINPVITHEGEETVIYVHIRNSVQIGFCFSISNFDLVNKTGMGFNIQAGDIVKIYVVDELSNDPSVNPILLQ